MYVVNGGRCELCGGDLGEDWEAHHEKQFANGGVTELTNGMALCRACHRQLHRRCGVIQPRGWQVEALAKFRNHRELAFLVEATPGAGKTIFSGLCARHLFDDEAIDFALVVVPTTALKGSADAGFLGDWHRCGVQLTTVLKDGRGMPSDFRGGIITYQQLPNFVTTLETWARKGARLFVVFDEIHHASEENVWGAASESAGRCAKSILAMTGTPFRGDGRRISFVRYDANDVAVGHHRYGYRQAVADKVCRPVVFMTDDGVARYILAEAEREVVISEATSKEEGPAAGAIFARESDWLRQVLAKADAKLDEYRQYDADAGGLIVCRPGGNASDDRHLHQIAKVVRDVTGEQPEVITHDDPDANAKIDRFRNSTARWLCSVRKVSEGVDIKRLRVQVLASRPSTELLFRQLVGRIVRADDPVRVGDATVFLAKFPQMREWAERIADEAKAGLDDAEKRKSREAGERQDDKEPSGYQAIGASHKDGGAISEFGEAYAPDEVSAAEQLKRGDPELIEVPVVKIAHLMRKLGIKPTPSMAAGQPLHTEKQQMRGALSRKARQLAIKVDPDNPDFAGVWKRLHRHLGVKSLDDLMDNHSIDVMRQAEGLLSRWMGESNESRAS